jgi:hypothetical protein
MTPNTFPSTAKINNWDGSSQIMDLSTTVPSTMKKSVIQVFSTYTHTLKGSLGSDVRVILNVTLDLK